jgi:hypothetical protein
MVARKVLVAKSALVLLTAAALFTLYQASFDVWMMSYPFADATVWRTRLYIRLATVVVIAFVWIAAAVWLFRQRRRSINATPTR